MRKPAISPTGWWIAGLLGKHFQEDRSFYWNNYRLIKAEDWRTAFQKAAELGEADARVGNEAFAERQEFIGISDLLPIYENFEDGAEIWWQEFNVSDEGDEIPIQVFSEQDLESEYGQPV